MMMKRSVLLLLCLLLLVPFTARADEPQPPADLAQLSIVAFPGNVHPGQTVHLSVSVHSDTAAQEAVVVVGAPRTLHIDRVTARNGDCADTGAQPTNTMPPAYTMEWQCLVPVAPDAPTMLDITAHVDPMPCTHLIRFYAATGGWLGDTEWLTVETPRCAVYIPFAAQDGY